MPRAAAYTCSPPVSIHLVYTGIDCSVRHGTNNYVLYINVCSKQDTVIYCQAKTRVSYMHIHDTFELSIVYARGLVCHGLSYVVTTSLWFFCDRNKGNLEAKGGLAKLPKF